MIDLITISLGGDRRLLLHRVSNGRAEVAEVEEPARPGYGFARGVGSQDRDEASVLSPNHWQGCSWHWLFSEDEHRGIKLALRRKALQALTVQGFSILKIGSLSGYPQNLLNQKAKIIPATKLKTAT